MCDYTWKETGHHFIEIVFFHSSSLLQYLNAKIRINVVRKFMSEKHIQGCTQVNKMMSYDAMVCKLNWQVVQKSFKEMH